jgi:hypothetical protein
MADVVAKGGYVVNLADLFEFCNDAREVINRIGHERFSEAIRAPLEKRYRAFRPATRSTPRQGRGQTFE